MESKVLNFVSAMRLAEVLIKNNIITNEIEINEVLDRLSYEDIQLVFEILNPDLNYYTVPPTLVVKLVANKLKSIGIESLVISYSRVLKLETPIKEI